MSKIVISGYYGFDNLGDEAVLAGIIKSLRKTRNNLEIVVLSSSPEITASRYQVSAIYRYHLPHIFKAINSCDLFISGGGSLLQDITSWKSVPYYLGLVFMAWILGKKTAFYAQGIGPIRSDIAAKMVSWMGKRVNLITVRDRQSRLLLSDLGLRLDRIRETVDPAFALKPYFKDNGDMVPTAGLPVKKTTNFNSKYESNVNIDVVLTELKDNNNDNKPLIGVSVRPWADNTYLQPLARAVDELALAIDASIIVIPMNYEQDYSLSLKFKELLSVKSGILEESYTPWLILGVFSQLDMVVGVRLHSLIFAAINRVPFLGISYDPKIDSFLNELNLDPPISLKNCDEKIIKKRLRLIWEQRQEVTVHLDRKITQYEKETEKQAVMVMELLN